MSATKRKPVRKPGKKSGARINQAAVINPLGIKASQKFELHANASLLALESGCATKAHLAHLHVLADMSERIGVELHVKQHAATIKRLCNQIHGDDYHCGHLTHVAMRVSTDVLLRWIMTQKNSDIAKHSRNAVRELAL